MKKIKNSIFIIVSVLIFSNCVFYNVGKGGIKEDFLIKEGILKKYNGLESNIQIPKSVTVIGKNAFKNNKKIQSVVISESVKTIKANAFRNNKNLEKIVIPSAVKEISKTAFKGCNKLTIYTQDNTYASLYAKQYNIEYIQIPEEIKQLEFYKYTAGTHPLKAKKKVLSSEKEINKVIKKVEDIRSDTIAQSTDMILGGNTILILIRYSNNETKKIICNAAIFTEDKTNYKIKEGKSIFDIWDSLNIEETEATQKDLREF